MKILVLGDGLLGKEIIAQTGWDYISRTKDSFDIRNSTQYKNFFLEMLHGSILVPKYDIIVNCIAHTDTYSMDRDTHWNVNFKAVVDLVDFCKEFKIKLVHISTDYVYTNSVDEATENDVPVHGQNWYSYTKLLGDSYAQLDPNNLILRGTHKKYPFPYDKAWINQVGNFDYVTITASLIIKIIDKNVSGIYNIGTELKTMFDLAKTSNNSVLSSLVPNNKIPLNVSMSINKLKGII